MFVILSSAIIRTHPTFFVLSFFALSITLTFAAIMSNAFYQFYSGSDVTANVAANYPKTVFLMTNLPFYLVFMGIANLVSGIISYNRQ